MEELTQATFLGEDLEQFIRYYHSYSYDKDWALKFKEKFPDFAHRDLVLFHTAEEFVGKTVLKLSKSSSILTKQGIIIHPIYPLLEIEMNKGRPLLYYPFDSGITEYWGDKNVKYSPGLEHICLRIVGVDILKKSQKNNLHDIVYH